jgi:arginyl-tRNA--protein-N-Asp/Glu arginylyltransferase
MRKYIWKPAELERLYALREWTTTWHRQGSAYASANYCSVGKTDIIMAQQYQVGSIRLFKDIFLAPCVCCHPLETQIFVDIKVTSFNMMKHFRQHLFRQITVMLLSVLPACSQSIATDYTPYQALSTTPLPASNSSGSFLWPLPGSVELYEPGSIMNISWTAKFSKTNLWLIRNFNYDTPIPLLGK